MMKYRKRGGVRKTQVELGPRGPFKFNDHALLVNHHVNGEIEACCRPVLVQRQARWEVEARCIALPVCME